MLNIWKKRWKNEGSSEDRAGVPIGGSELTASALESTEAAQPNGHSLSDSSSVSGPSKRHGDEIKRDSTSRKRRKVSDIESNSSFVNSVTGREALALALKENSWSLFFVTKLVTNFRSSYFRCTRHCW